MKTLKRAVFELVPAKPKAMQWLLEGVDEGPLLQSRAKQALSLIP